MATYLFSDVVSGAVTITSFDPAVDVLDLQVSATAVKVKLGTSGVTFTTATGSVLLPILAEQVVNSTISHNNIALTAGSLIIGDNTADTVGDAAANNIAGLVGDGNQYLGLDGADTFTGGSLGDVAYGNKGDDYLIGNGGADTLYGGQGIDFIDGGLEAGGDGNMLIYGNLDTDTMIGGSRHDIFYGGQGNDEIDGLGGNDTIYGNKGDDFIAGGTGNNWLYGGQGADTIDFGTGSQLVYGNLDNDSIFGGAGSATIYGGQGDDTISAPVVDGSGGNFIYGNKGDDIIYAGDMAADSITPGNMLMGGPGDDTIYAGQWGGDTMEGGSGADLFIWNHANALDPSNTVTRLDYDYILDFETIDRMMFGVAEILATGATPTYNPVKFFTTVLTGSVAGVMTFTPGKAINGPTTAMTLAVDRSNMALTYSNLFRSLKFGGTTNTAYAFVYRDYQTIAATLATVSLIMLRNTQAGPTIDKSSIIHALGLMPTNYSNIANGLVDIILF